MRLLHCVMTSESLSRRMFESAWRKSNSNGESQVMKHCRFHVTATLTVAIFVASIDAPSAAPFTFDEPFNFRDHRDNTLINGGISDFLQFGIDAVNGNVFVPGIKVTGKNSQTNETFALEACGASSVCYFSLIPHTPARANGGWQILGMSGVDSGRIFVPAFGTGPGTNALPFAQNVQIIGNNSTPTITWTLPPESATERSTTETSTGGGSA